ncbi:reverse transcriptase [Plakobranchus ocellatus]|uniref:Reverse transcriptase n=1 Tax=Plakobranchus ocellatus TaxID=259542 RepID=A0AAV4D9M6_9GAST|nr:reverse transcriptase [Plakobranchus ocellatus]
MNCLLSAHGRHITFFRPCFVFYIEKFTSELQDAARWSIPSYKGAKFKARVPWFTQEWDIPPSWREASVVIIPKLSKDPSNYRPIALTSYLCKTLERMRMTDWSMCRATLSPEPCCRRVRYLKALTNPSSVQVGLRQCREWSCKRSDISGSCTSSGPSHCTLSFQDVTFQKLVHRGWRASAYQASF